MVRSGAACLATSPARDFASSECKVPLSVMVFLSASSETVTSLRSACWSACLTASASFNQKTASDRSALLELNGTIYVAFGSYGDADPYHGWILGFSASNLARTIVFNASPNGQRAGIWGGPVASEDR